MTGSGAVHAPDPVLGNRRIVGGAATPRVGCHRHQPQQGEWVVVSRNAVAALDAAAVAAVHDDLLPLRFEEGSDRRHQGPARTRPIAGTTRIDVARGQAERAMIPVGSTGDGWADKGAAATAFERLPAIGPVPRPHARWRVACQAGMPMPPIVDDRWHGVEIDQAVDSVAI